MPEFLCGPGGAMDPSDLTTEERDVIDQFREFLAKAPPRHGPSTPEQEAFRQHTLVDPGWREFLGLGPIPEGASDA